MKTILTIVFSLLLVKSNAQHLAIYNNADTVAGFDSSKGNGLRMIKIPVAINPDSITATGDLKVSLIDIGSGTLKATLYQNELKIQKGTGLMPAYVICNLMLSNASEKYETLRIYKVDDPVSYFTVVVAPKPKQDSAQPRTAAAADAATKMKRISSKHITLDNKTTTFYFNGEKGKGVTADLSLSLKRDTVQAKNGKDTLYLFFDNSNLPNQSNDSFQVFYPLNPVIIDENAWKQDSGKDIRCEISIRINNPYLSNQPDYEAYGKITLEGSDKSFHMLRFMKDTVRHNPGFMFLVAGSFDFDQTVKTGFLGHANIWSPNLIPYGKKGMIGINAGIMKIDYAKGGRISDLNRTYYVEQNVLMDPLKNKPDDHYIKQYNKISYESTNTSWSFYAQPTIRFCHRDKVNLYANLHTELFVNKWNIKAKISNLSVDSTQLIGSGSTIKFEDENKFTNAATVYDSSGVNNTLNVYLGAGLTAEIAPWQGANVFLQTSLGGIATPNETLTIDTSNGKPLIVLYNSFFYLTRCYLEQKISSNVDAILGYDCRGYFGKAGSIYYACYLGLNISLDGLFLK